MHRRQEMLGIRRVLKTGCFHFSLAVSPLLFTAVCESWMSRFSVRATSPNTHVERCSSCQHAIHIALLQKLDTWQKLNFVFPRETVHPRLVFYFNPFQEKEENHDSETPVWFHGSSLDHLETPHIFIDISWHLAHLNALSDSCTKHWCLGSLQSENRPLNED